MSTKEIEVQDGGDTTFTTPVRLEGEHDFIVPAFLLVSADTREQAEAKASELEDGINELFEMGDQSAIMVVDQEAPTERWCGSEDHDEAPTSMPMYGRHVGIMVEVEVLLRQYLAILQRLLDDNVTSAKVDVVKVEAAIKSIRDAMNR